MDRATEIAHRVLPCAGSEWPLSAHGRVIALEHAANIIRAELAAEREACAKIADAVAAEVSEGSCSWGTANIIAEAIRNRHGNAE